MRHLTAVVLGLVLLSAVAPPRASAQEIPDPLRKKFEALLKAREIRPREAPPSWYDSKAEPLFRFVQISDIHLTKRRVRLLAEAARFVNEKVKPAFVAVTGDNAGNTEIAAQRFLADLLEEKFDAPCHVIRGDNWARNFSKVFGSTRYAFECGGVRFVFTGLDRDVEGMGVGRFDAETWTWMKKEFAPEKPMPVVLFFHENIQPPVFLDAGRLDALLEASACAAASFTGHLHYDLEFQVKRVKHILAPGFGPHRHHGLKVCEVHRDFIAVRTVERHDGAFGWTSKFQKVDFPVPARWGGEAKVGNLRGLPERETDFDMKADEAIPGVLFQMAMFARRAGLTKEFLEATKDAEEPGGGEPREAKKESKQPRGGNPGA
jgi:hypothetical protein